MQNPRPTRLYRLSRSQTQSGAVALILLLILVATASTFLLSKLNSGIRYSLYSPQTSNALEEAKDALLAWAVNHPFNPGTLPMPDRNGDGDYDGDADCYNGPNPIGNNLLLGRLPWRDYPGPCKDAAGLSGLSLYVTDKSGEQLWYAVSKNLVYESPDYPYISPGLLQKSTDWITVRDKNGSVLSDRVAFVIIAPGPVLFDYSDCDGLSYAGQNRSADAPDPDNYLDRVIIGSVTYNNADYDQDYIIYPNSNVTSDSSTQEKCDQFNDQLVFVTIDELMDAVSKRVLNETTNVLTAYHNSNGALPWLVPFADPKSDAKVLRGDTTSAGSDLVDTSTDFTEWGVTAGDTVWNLTDGSRGIVDTGGVAANTLTLNGGLKFGTNNTFSSGDEYFVEVRYMSDILMATASGGSVGNTLRDFGRDFDVLGIHPGDVIENLDDGPSGSSGIVSTVEGDQITVAALTGGTDNAFSSGDEYRIRSNTSTVTGTTANLILTDTNVDFIAMGVQVGDIVHNLWDQTISRITSIDSANQLTVDALKLGTGVVFNQNEPYQISRYNSRDNTRIGLLPIHQEGEIFPTGFSMDWYSPNSSSSVTTTLATDNTYTANLRDWAEESSGYSDTITVAEADAKCLWVSAEIARCKGTFTDTNADFLVGTATIGSSGTTLFDTSSNFPAKFGVKRGDLIFDNVNRMGIVSSLTGNNKINGVIITTNPASPALNFSTNNSYRIKPAAKQKSGSALTPYSLYNSTSKTFSITIANASDIQAGDTIENLTYGGIGKIISISGNRITASQLIGGSYDDICPGPISGVCSSAEQYRIHYDFVDKRVYEFNVTFKGSAAKETINEKRVRSVCEGYDASCTTAINNANLKGDGTDAFVTIRDYEGSTEVGRATNILPVAGLANRSLKVSGLEFYLDNEYGDLPDWFVRNKWYQYVMVAYSDGESPGGGTCVQGTDCLTLNLRDATSAVVSFRDDVRALVMLAKDTLPTQSWTNATVDDYFDDNSNINISDDIFDKYPESATFNDLIRIAVSCPTDTTKLCWSN